MLGAVFDTSLAPEGVIQVRNKEGRLVDLESAVRALRGGAWITQPQAESLLGRLSFADNQIFSRVSSLMLPDLKRRALHGSLGAASNADLMRELNWMLRFLRTSVPRRVISGDTRPPLVILTDASLEEEAGVAGIGAVMLNADGRPEKFISEIVPPDFLSLLQAETTFIITALEVLPVFFVRTLWAPAMLHRRCFVFIDNNGARYSLVKAYSPAPSVRRVLRNIVLLGATSPCFTWYSRVPSPSNLADEASRNFVGNLLGMGAKRDLIPNGLWRRAIE